MPKIVGVERIDYVSRKTGKAVKGYRFHCTDKIRNCDGLGVLSEFISEEVCNDFISEHGVDIIGLEVDFVYNKFGNCVGIRSLG